MCIYVFVDESIFSLMDLPSGEQFIPRTSMDWFLSSTLYKTPHTSRTAYPTKKIKRLGRLMIV